MPSLEHDEFEDPTTCYRCDDTFEYIDGYYCDSCDERHCENCGECESCDDDDYGRAAGVHEWNYRPSPYRPKGEYPQRALMGVELEVGGRARSIVAAVRGIDAHEDHLYMKEDGSISGVEIVTHPMTLEWSKSFDFEGLLSGLRYAGSYVEDGYGLHVHVSRNAFRRGGKRSSQHAMTWLMFLYRNAEQVQELARRTESRWAKFSAPRTGELARKANLDRPDVDSDRYVAVNCNNTRTYELRFFRSTLSVQEFRAAIEFADASVEYTRAIKTADVLTGNGLTFGHFAQWLGQDDDRRVTYSNLVEEIARLNLDDDDKPSVVKPRRQVRNAPTAATVGSPMRLPAAAEESFMNGTGIVQHRSGTRYRVSLDRLAFGEYSLRNVDPDGVMGQDDYALHFFVQDGWSVVYGARRPLPADHCECSDCMAYYAEQGYDVVT